MTRLCTNCRYYQKDGLDNDWKYARCTCPEICVEANPVVGGVRTLVYCHKARKSPCGQEGKFWEAKKLPAVPWWLRLLRRLSSGM